PLRHVALRDRRRLHRRVDGGTHAGVHRQEDSAEGSEDGAVRDSRDGAVHPRGVRRDRGDSVRERQLLESCRAGDGEPRECRRARPERDSLHLHEPDREQRQRIRRHHRQHALVRPGRRAVHALWTVLVHHPRARDCRQSGRQEDGADVGGHTADARAALRRAARRDRDRGRGADVLPGAVARADCRALPDARGSAVHVDVGSALMAASTVVSAPRPLPPVTPAPVDESLIPKKLVRARPLFDPEILGRALKDSVLKLNPVTLMKNPVIFVVEVGAALVLVFLLRDIVRGVGAIGFELQIDLWLWFTVLFATFAEAMAEARGKAQAESLRKTKTDTIANRIADGDRIEKVASSKLRANDVVLVTAGETIPGDGEVIEGVATVDESVITGESAPVIRESGGDRSAVTGGTRVLSDWIRVRITSNPGETFLDRMIALVEGAQRQKTPNEIALNILLAGLSIIFLLAVVTLQPFAIYSGSPQTVFVLVSLLVCLIPTTIGGLLSAIGIAGMERLVQHNVLAMSGRAVEAAGDVNTLLLDKTGTITLGNR